MELEQPQSDTKLAISDIIGTIIEAWIKGTLFGFLGFSVFITYYSVAKMVFGGLF
jgi:phosphatidate phosphatase PAH1